MRDPMHMMLEIRRILEPGGELLLTTPNCAGLHVGFANVLDGRGATLRCTRITAAPNPTIHPTSASTLHLKLPG